MSTSNPLSSMGVPGLFSAEPLRESATKTCEGEPIVSEYRLNDGVLVVVRLRDCSDELRQQGTDDLQAIMQDQRRPFCIVVDMRGLSAFPATQRHMYAEFRRKLAPVYASFHRRTVYLTDDEKQRGFLTAISWQARATGSDRTFTSDLKDAWSLCAEALA